MHLLSTSHLLFISRFLLSFVMSSQAIAWKHLVFGKIVGAYALGDKYKGEFANGRPNGIDRVWQRQDQKRRHLQRFICRCFTERAFIFPEWWPLWGWMGSGVRHGKGQLFQPKVVKQTFEYGIMVSNAPVRQTRPIRDRAQNQARWRSQDCVESMPEPKPEPQSHKSQSTEKAAAIERWSRCDY